MKLVNVVMMISFMAVGPLLYAQKGSAPAKGPAYSEPSKEVRAQMAQMHEKMATCLRSDKLMSQCQDEMMSNCPMGGGGMMMHRRGMHGRNMMGAGGGGCWWNGNNPSTGTSGDQKAPASK